MILKNAEARGSSRSLNSNLKAIALKSFNFYASARIFGDKILINIFIGRRGTKLKYIIKNTGSRKNKLAILVVGRLLARHKMQEYQTYSECSARSQSGWIDAQNVKLFLSKPKVT